MDLQGYCAAPWIEGVLYEDGKLQTCCRNGTNLGDWKQAGLKKTWQGKRFRDFRRSIREGRFHDAKCKSCYFNGTARTLTSELEEPFAFNTQVLLENLKYKDVADIVRLENLFSLRQASGETRKTLRKYFLALRKLSRRSHLYSEEVVNALYKLKVIGTVVKSFLGRDLKPQVIAPYRQVQLVSKCNARCVQCTGLFTGEIVNGTALESEHVSEAFSAPDQILNFFMTGSEFIIYKEWQKIARVIRSNGTKVSISTNGIRLTRENARFLIDHEIVHSLNISMDGASREMVEAIRVKVDFDDLVENIKYLICYASEQNYNFSLSFSFVLMKQNAHEFPQLVRLVKQLQGARQMPNVIVYCQSLENYPEVENYSDFVAEQHHSLLGRPRLEQIFKDTLVASMSTGIPVKVFYSMGLSEFVTQGCPYPELPGRQVV